MFPKARDLRLVSIIRTRSYFKLIGSHRGRGAIITIYILLYEILLTLRRPIGRALNWEIPHELLPILIRSINRNRMDAPVTRIGTRRPILIVTIDSLKQLRRVRDEFGSEIVYLEIIQSSVSKIFGMDDNAIRCAFGGQQGSWPVL